MLTERKFHKIIYLLLELSLILQMFSSSEVFLKLTVTKSCHVAKLAKSPLLLPLLLFFVLLTIKMFLPRIVGVTRKTTKLAISLFIPYSNNF